MPEPMRRRLPHRIVVTLVSTLLAAVALPAVAQAACATTPVTKAFQRFGDTANYSLLSNGHFESGSSGWSLTGGAIVSGNESYKVRSSADTRALQISPTGTVVSPAFCVGVEHPTFRFFARQASGSWATMAVRLRWSESNGRVNETTVGSLNSSSFASWQPTSALPLATTLPLWQSGQSLSVQLVFDPDEYGGAWAIDDVYIDPYSRG
jgi:hypothetical protein